MKYPRKNIFDPRKHNGTIALDPRDLHGVRPTKFSTLAVPQLSSYYAVIKRVAVKESSHQKE